MNITKAIAQEIAEKLLEEKKAEIEKAQEAVLVWAKAKITSIIPKPIMDLFSKYGSYINCAQYWYFQGPGLNQMRIILPCTVPKGSSNNILLDQGEAQELLHLNDAAEKLVSECQELFASIVNSLVGLRTYNRIQKEFPEAYKLLPQDRTSTALVVDIKKLRCQLNTAACA